MLTPCTTPSVLCAICHTPVCLQTEPSDQGSAPSGDEDPNDTTGVPTVYDSDYGSNYDSDYDYGNGSGLGFEEFTPVDERKYPSLFVDSSDTGYCDTIPNEDYGPDTLCECMLTLNLQGVDVQGAKEAQDVCLGYLCRLCIDQGYEIRALLETGKFGFWTAVTLCNDAVEGQVTPAMAYTANSLTSCNKTRVDPDDHFPTPFVKLKGNALTEFILGEFIPSTHFQHAHSRVAIDVLLSCRSSSPATPDTEDNGHAQGGFTCWTSRWISPAKYYMVS